MKRRAYAQKICKPLHTYIYIFAGADGMIVNICTIFPMDTNNTVIQACVFHLKSLYLDMPMYFPFPLFALT